MASAAPERASRARPALATTYEGDDAALLAKIAPLVDAIEIAPDSIAASDGAHSALRRDVLDEYQSVADDVDFVAHGVGLSIGSFDGWNDDYLRLIDGLFDRFALLWHSEHLALTRVAGENVGTMFSLPRTDEAVDLVCARVDCIQRRYGVPFLLEHVIQLLPDPPGRHSPAGFINAITRRTGCGVIIDAYNLECDAHNQGLDIDAFLDELDMEPVREMHLAGGVARDGFLLDVHSGLVAESTLALGLNIAARAPNLGLVTYEFLKEAVPLIGHDAICAELRRVRAAFAS
jgi:uncharacterized protein (UPF0276 family)